MADFNIAYALTMGEEGDYANNPKDRGGETYKGIARKFNPGWIGWADVDRATAASKNVAVINKVLGANGILQANVRVFYKNNYWDVNRLDSISSQVLAEKLFDIGVNMGTGTAAKFLQDALNLLNGFDIVVDGKVGGQTIATANAYKRPELLTKVISTMQGNRYINRIREEPSQADFANTWFGRAYRWLERNT